MPLCESDLPLSQNNRCGLAVHNNVASCLAGSKLQLNRCYNYSGRSNEKAV